MLKRLHELISLFIEQGYKYEHLIDIYRDYMDDQDLYECDVNIEDLIDSLESEMSYWE